MQTALHFEVVGRLWSGGRAAYQYTDPSAPSEPCSKGEARALRDAIIAGQAKGAGLPSMGDFASIEDVRIVHERNDYEAVGRGINRRVDTFTTVAGWSHPSSASAYRRMVNGR